MTMVTIRKCGPKSRKGCQTCKIRHVKCDEEKPSCQRCRSTGRSCDGYSAASSPSGDRQVIQSHISRAMNRSPSQENGQQRRSFEFFCTETAPSIAGFFSSPVWNIVLQACEKETVVKQAVVALGALHERLSISGGIGLRDDIPIATNFPLRQYLNALGALRKYLTTSEELSLDTILVCALIHISIEVMQNNYANAVVHLENSLQLLRQPFERSQHSETTSSEDSVHPNALPFIKVDHDLSRTFVRLDLQASTYQGMRPPSLTNNDIDGIVPGRLSSIVQSKDVLDVLTGKLCFINRTVIEEYRYRKNEDIPLDTVNQVAKLKESIDLWSERFEKYVNRTTSKFSRQEQFTIDILLINHRVISIEAATCTRPETIIFDQYDHEFDEIVTLAARVIQYLDSRISQSRSFLLDIGVIHPLYWTALNCREHWIRQRAMSLLRSIKFQEGVWIAAAQASRAQVAISRELQSAAGVLVLGARPPEFARVHSVGTDLFDPVKRVADVHMSQKLNGLKGPWSDHVEWVTW